MKVAPLSQIGLIPGSLDLLFAQPVHLIQSGLHLLLDGKRDFQRQGSDGLDEKLADSLVHVLTQDMLAYQDDVVGPIALTRILWHDLGLPRVVNRPSSGCHRHHRQPSLVTTRAPRVVGSSCGPGLGNHLKTGRWREHSLGAVAGSPHTAPNEM